MHGRLTSVTSCCAGVSAWLPVSAGCLIGLPNHNLGKSDGPRVFTHAWPVLYFPKVSFQHHLGTGYIQSGVTDMDTS